LQVAVDIQKSPGSPVNHAFDGLTLIKTNLNEQMAAFFDQVRAVQ
jgi:hypothetical protein